MAVCLAACDSDISEPNNSPVPSANGTVAFIDENGTEIHLPAIAKYDPHCGGGFELIVTDDVDKRFCGLFLFQCSITEPQPGAPFVLEASDAQLWTIRNNVSGGISRQLLTATSGNLTVTYLDLSTRLISGTFDLTFPDTVEGRATISYTRGSFTNIPMEIRPQFDSSILIPFDDMIWSPSNGYILQWTDSINIGGGVCFRSRPADTNIMTDVHITIAKPAIGTFPLDNYTYFTTTFLPEDSLGNTLAAEVFSSRFVKKDAGQITITEIDLSKNKLIGSFTVTAATAGGKTITFTDGTLNFRGQ